MEMQVQEREGGVTNVVLRGRLDTVGAGAIDLNFNVVAGAKHAIIVDLSEVDFLSSLGIRVLVMGARAVKNKGGKTVVFSPAENVSSALRTARIDELIPVISDRAAALAAVAR
jgi:anti-sigma B factor antagonist